MVMLVWGLVQARHCQSKMMWCFCGYCCCNSCIFCLFVCLLGVLWVFFLLGYFLFLEGGAFLFFFVLGVVVVFCLFNVESYYLQVCSAKKGKISKWAVAIFLMKCN